MALPEEKSTTKGKDNKGPGGAFRRQKGDPRKGGGGLNEGMNLS